MTNFYPVFLNLTGRRCVIIGGGQIATGKISKLLDSGANIVVISPDVPRKFGTYPTMDSQSFTFANTKSET